ncbi:MAG: sugar ABC transporter substrate-binding protein [Caldilineaceae bacterium]|nr:sugar ABC transporter substrate-binding protein [Caldilineaceae bacterium]
MVSRRTFLTLAAGSMAATVVAACAAPVAAPSGGAPAEPAQDVTTIVYWALQGENGDNNLVRGVIDPFHEQRSDVRVDMQEVPWDGYYEKYQTLSAAGQAPDIAFVSAAWIQDFARLGIALNLDPFIEKTGAFGPEAEEDLFLSTLDGLRYPKGGSLYAVPYEWVTICFYYNKDIFDAAGEPYPSVDWTYDNVLEAAQRLTTRDGDTVEQFGFISHWDYSILDSVLHANGGNILSEDYSGAVLDSPQNIETVQWMVDLIQQHGVAPLPAEFTEGGPYESLERISVAGDLSDRPQKVDADGGAFHLPPAIQHALPLPHGRHAAQHHPHLCPVCAAATILCSGHCHVGSEGVNFPNIKRSNRRPRFQCHKRRGGRTCPAGSLTTARVTLVVAPC